MRVEVGRLRPLQQLVGDIRTRCVGAERRRALLDADLDAVDFVLLVGLRLDDRGEVAVEVRPVDIEAGRAGALRAANSGDDGATEVDDPPDLLQPHGRHDAGVVAGHLVEQGTRLEAIEDGLAVLAVGTELREGVDGLGDVCDGCHLAAQLVDCLACLDICDDRRGGVLDGFD